MSLTKEEIALEKELIKQFGGAYGDIIKGFYRYKDGTVRLGGSLSTFLQNRVRKRYQKEIPNLRLLTKKEGLHIPTGNYIGPGTNLEDADKYGPVDHKTYGPVDEIARTHDYNYHAVDEAKDDMTKEERRDAIFDADKIMLEQLDALPEDIKKSKTWKLAKSGIALKNFAETALNKNLYGGCSKCGGNKIDASKYISGLVKAVVDHDLDASQLKRLMEIEIGEIDDDDVKLPKKYAIDIAKYMEVTAENMEKYTHRYRKQQGIRDRYEFTIYLTGETKRSIKGIEENVLSKYAIDSNRKTHYVPIQPLHYRLTGDIINFYVGVIPVIRLEDNVRGWVYSGGSITSGGDIATAAKKIYEATVNDTSKLKDTRGGFVYQYGMGMGVLKTTNDEGKITEFLTRQSIIGGDRKLDQDFTFNNMNGAYMGVKVLDKAKNTNFRSAGTLQGKK